MIDRDYKELQTVEHKAVRQGIIYQEQHARKETPRRYQLVMKNGCCWFIVAMALLLVSTTGANADDKKITLELRDMSVQDALSALLDKADVSYVLKEGITGNIERLSFKSVDFRTALDSILQSSKLILDIEDGIYIVSPKEPPKQEIRAIAIPQRPKEQPEQQPKEEVEPVVMAEVPGVLNEDEEFQQEYPAFGFNEFGYWPYYQPQPYEYAGVIHNPPAGIISFPRFQNRIWHPPLPPAPWRGTTYINGVPVY